MSANERAARALVLKSVASAARMERALERQFAQLKEDFERLLEQAHRDGVPFRLLARHTARGWDIVTDEDGALRLERALQKRVARRTRRLLEVTAGTIAARERGSSSTAEEIDQMNEPRVLSRRTTTTTTTQEEFVESPPATSTADAEPRSELAADVGASAATEAAAAAPVHVAASNNDAELAEFDEIDALAEMDGCPPCDSRAPARQRSRR